MNKRNRKLYYFLKKYLLGQIWKIILLLIVVFAGVAMSNVLPYLYGKIIDKITVRQLTGIEIFMLLYLSVAIMAVLLSMIETVLGEYISWILTSKLKMRLLKKIIYLRCKELDSFNKGELMSRLDGDAGTIVDFYLNMVTSILTIFFNLTISVIFIFNMSERLAIIAVIFVPLSILTNFYFREKFGKLQKKQKEYGDRFASFRVELFQNLFGMKAYQQEKQKISDYQTFLREQWRYDKRGQILSGESQLVNTFISMTGTLLLMYLSAKLIVTGNFTIGGMVSFMTYVSRLNAAVGQYLSLNMESEQVLICINRVGELEELEDETCFYFETSGKDKKWDKITAENVSFSYGEKEVLKDFSLSVTRSGLYSIVGKNGCGKSSFLKLMIRYYDYTGSLKIGGKELCDYDLGIVRKYIAYIPKEPYILNQSIKENIILLKPEAGKEEISKAVEMAGLTELVRELPDGLETCIGESGKLISSGQRQKISIARAILCQPDIYLFDEITSDLDGKAEIEILNVMRILARDRIVLQVAHRISAVKNSDRIFLLQQGKIIAEGNHLSMLEQSELYREMFQQQNAGEKMQ